MANQGHSTPTGNVVVDPDSVWGADGKKLADRSKRRPVNPHNIAEDQYQGSRLKGRKKFGKVFDDAAKDAIADEAVQAAKLAEATSEDEETEGLDEVAHLLDPEDEGQDAAQELDLENLGAVLSEIKNLDLAKKGGDNAADDALLTILQAEYSRPGGARPQVRGALSALGYKKPGK